MSGGLIQSLFTIAGSILVFVAGQLLLKLLIEPVHELKKAIGEVRFNLAYYATIIHTPISRNKERSEKAYEAIMKNSCDLITKADAIPFNRCLTKIKYILPIKDIKEAAGDLRIITTFLHETDEQKANSHIEMINKVVKKIEKNLKLLPLE